MYQQVLVIGIKCLKKKCNKNELEHSTCLECEHFDKTVKISMDILEDNRDLPRKEKDGK